MSAEVVARRILAGNGCSDPHPALLADTVREVEYHGLADAEPEAAPEWQVVKEEWGVPCSHPSCAILHKRLAREPYADGAEHTVWAVRPGNVEVQVRTRFWHEVTRSSWIVLHNGERVGEPADTKRAAKVEMGRLQA